MTGFNTAARRLLAALLLTFSMGAFAACGGDDKKDSTSSSSTTTQATTTEAAPAAPEEEAPADDFAAQGNALCEEVEANIETLAAADDPAAVVELIAEFHENLAALEPPAGQEDQFAQLVELSQAQVTEAQRIVEDGGTLEDLAAIDDSEIDAVATELGLTACAS